MSNSQIEKIIYSDSTVNKILALDRIIIYGAGVMGRALKKCIESAPYNKQVSFFLVNGAYDNPDCIDGTDIYRLEDAGEWKDETIIVALNENNLKTAVNDLELFGFKKLVVLNAAGDAWSYIKGNYFWGHPEVCYLPYVPLETCCLDYGNEEYGLSIYVINSIYDRKIKKTKMMSSFEKNIQVGRAISHTRICDICDDTGYNISEMNRQFCELTGLFWAWKNDSSEYVGVCHYRRRFDFSDRDFEIIRRGGADVVLTIPVINTRGIKVQYELSHSAYDWEIMKSIIFKKHPKYKDALLTVEKESYFFPYNMFIMRRDILEDYCEWLFSILFECVKRIGIKTDVYQNRYPGFLSERLLGVYLFENKDKYRIFMAKKRYLE